ncbi:MAG: xylulokinase, partial [Spirochaetota bacterium]
MPLVMGIDIGTSGCKTVLVDHGGAVVASAFAEYPLYSERHGWSEQDPADWWNAVKDTIRLVLAARPDSAKELIGIGLTGQMHGLVALDQEHRVLRRSILWNDSRTGPQCAEIIEKAGGLEGLLSITNNQMLPGYTGGKILWLAQKEPDTHKRMRSFVNPKDFIRLKLTGELATEVSDASGTGMFNVAGRKWAPQLFDIVGLPLESAPKAYESTETSGLIRDAVATELGLPPGLPVVGGGGDAVIQTLGTGVTSGDVLMTTIGTSGIVSTALDEFKPNPGGKIQVFCNVIPGTWHAMGVTLSAGASLKWARELFGSAEEEVARALGEDVYDLISREVEKSPIGSRGLFFLPYINGERCPYSDPHARGAFIGLTLGTRKGDLYRSVM